MKRLRKNCKGFTLVEIIVTFTLTAIFMSAAALTLSTFMRSHTVASAVATEQSVASIVIGTASDALSAAGYESDIFGDNGNGLHLPAGESVSAPSDSLDEDAKKKCALLILDDGTGNSEVWYVDGETNNVVRMYVKEESGSGESAEKKGYLALDYYVRPEAGPAIGVEWKKVPWQLGKGVYQNCSIESFNVSVVKTPAGAPSSCLSITLKLKNGLAGEDHSFTLKRAFDCYNLAPENIVAK